MGFTKTKMANPDKKILIEQALKDIKKFLINSKMNQDHQIMRLELF